MWPMKDKVDISIKWKEKSGWRHANVTKPTISPVMTQYAIAIIQHHLLISTIITVGCGLNFYLIWAWKSGKNPSASKDTSKQTNPMT